MDSRRFWTLFATRERKSEWSPESVPLLVRNEEEELRESTEAFPKGAVSIDGTLATDGTFYVFEIQGLDSGIKGIDEHMDKGEVKDSLKRLASRWTRFGGSKYQNPRWFIDVTRDKRMQDKFIPAEHRPETVSDANFDHLFKRGKVIIKPHDEAQGFGIRIFDATQVEEARAYAKKLKGWRNGGYVAQTYIESVGAELASEDIKGNAASMRLIVPFKMVHGKPVPTIPRFGYQRVAQYKVSEIGQRIRGKRIRMEDTGVVNLARGAAAVPMSDKEYQAALPVVLQIIESLAKYGKTTKDFQEALDRKLFNTASDVYGKLSNTYDVRIDYDSYRSKRPGEGLLFMRFLERELALINPQIWEDRSLRRSNRRPEIVHVSESRQGKIKLKDRKYKDHWHAFNLDEPGSLSRVLKQFIADNKTVF